MSLPLLRSAAGWCNSLLEGSAFASGCFAALGNRGAPGGRWLVTPLKPEAGGQGLPDTATGSIGEPVG